MASPRVLPEVPEFPPVELDLSGEDIPIVRWDDGTYRFAGTRVLLYLVAQGLNSGMTPADLVRSLTSLNIADVEKVSEFYFRRKAEVDEFVRVIEEQGEARSWRRYANANEPAEPRTGRLCFSRPSFRV